MSSDLLTRPLTSATLTIRVIKNFPYRTAKNLVLHNLDLTTLTSGDLKERVRSEILSSTSGGGGGWKAYKGVVGTLDTLKLYTKAHGTKTNNLIINMEDEGDELIFGDDGRALEGYGCEHETEISFFKLEDYLEFKGNPEEKW
ncbi:unnamed protein product [Tuber melanosporum]|uniref:(Perigord truffle) hypothetical protein n=1 Tax=Tuber melanosporum (strain Mel28) TaxID=656061 RepID=D5GG38_TUBMM|nr:uncharacterized protein GSTUM_00001979001 [Tuber melanosporum]KAG0125722.1 hypothetical protein HOY82DRAFT_571210 [Tuber indicum]CAZ83481.1 unnamed protein product [Tuber melanosporum]